MTDFISTYFPIICPIVIIMLVALLIFFIFRRMIAWAVSLCLVIALIVVTFTIFWGDGSSYVSKITSILTPENQETIENAYAYYKDKDAEDPTIDYNRVSDTVTNVFS